MGIESPDATDPAAPPVRRPSGLFPVGPPRPIYREPHPVRTGAVLVGAGVAAGWLVLFGLLGTGLVSRVWWLLVAGLASWAAALALACYGDRGAAVGVAVATGFGWALAGGAVTLYWVVTADWPLW